MFKWFDWSNVKDIPIASRCSYLETISEQEKKKKAREQKAARKQRRQMLQASIQEKLTPEELKVIKFK